MFAPTCSINVTGAKLIFKDISESYVGAGNDTLVLIVEVGTLDEIKAKCNPTPATVEKTCFLAQGKSYKKSVAYTWNAVEGASYYKVYQAKCGKKAKKVKTTTATSYTKKKLRRRSTYKCYVVAYDAAGNKIAKTPTIHNMTKYGKRSNATAVAASATASIKAGESTNVGAYISAKDSKKKILGSNHCAKIRYYSADNAVATVDKNGNVKGVAAGTANIYSVAPNGVSAVSKVTVKSKAVTFNLNNEWDITMEYSTWKEAVESNAEFSEIIEGDTVNFKVIDMGYGLVGLRYEIIGQGSLDVYLEHTNKDKVLLTEEIQNGVTYMAGA